MGQTAKRHDAGTFKPHVKKGDEVLVLTGRSLGERGRIVSVDPKRERAIVEGVNLITKHQRAQQRQQGLAAQQQAGRIQKPAPIHVSNLMVVCPNCQTPTRVEHREEDNRWVRACKKCHESLERTD